MRQYIIRSCLMIAMLIMFALAKPNDISYEGAILISLMTTYVFEPLFVEAFIKKPTTND